MLEFAEALLKDLRSVIRDTESIVLGGAISDMERYRFVMGRLEGLKLVESLIKEQLKKRSEDSF